MGKIYVGDSGTVLSLDTGIDLADVTDQSILCRKPDGTEVEWSATIDETSLQYELDPEDIADPGVYVAIAYIESPSFLTGKVGEPYEFTIYERFK